VLHLLLGPMFFECFVIDRILVLINMGNASADKLTHLGFIHRESFHWYNRLPSSLFFYVAQILTQTLIRHRYGDT